MFRTRYRIILMLVALMAAAIYVLDRSIMADQAQPVEDASAARYDISIPTEEGVFRRSEYSLEYSNMPNDDRRNLEEYYKNRAYPGAPPVIPHELLSEQGIGEKACLQCHENGGYVERFKAYAPITPHPEMISCKQCHVAAVAGDQFKTTDWKKIDHPEIHRAAMSGSPPVIPHTLQLRENCLACHSGPAAPKEILVSHPERINCRQCHAATKSNLLVEWDTASQWTESKIEWVIKQ